MYELLQQLSTQLQQVDPRTPLMQVRVYFICHQEIYADLTVADALRVIANNEHAARVSQKVRLDYPGAKHPI